MVFVRSILMLTAFTAALQATLLEDIPLTSFEDGKAPARGGEGVQPESKIVLVDQPVKSGVRSAKLHYVFREGVIPRQYVEARFNQQLAGDVKAISCHLFGDNSRQTLKMRVIDAEGEYHQFAGGAIDWSGWRKVTFDFSTNMKEVHWGGDGDGNVDMPVKGFCYLIDSPIEPFESDVYIDDVTYTADGEQLGFVHLDLRCAVEGNAFYGRKPAMALVLRNALATAISDVPIAVTVADVDGTSVLSTRRTLTLAGGQEKTMPIRPRIRKYGLYRVTVSMGASRTDTLTFSYLPEAAPQKADPGSSFGVSMHFGHGGRGPIENNLRLASDLGMRWLRDDASWSSVEKVKGEYSVPPTFDRFLRTARSEWGCEPMIILDYSNGLYCKNRAVETEAERNAFAAWSEFMAHTYKDSVTYWEVWNEANISGFWKPKPDPKLYALLLKATYEAVKRGNPDAQVVAMVTAGIDLRFIESVLAEGTVGYFDAVSVHPYRYPKAPEAGRPRMVEHLQELVALLDRYGAVGIPIYNTEVGWPNHVGPRGSSEKTSANYLARMYTLLRQIPSVKATFWYDFQNDGLDREYNENNFGILHNDFTPKAPAIAYRMTSMALEGRRFVRQLKTSDAIRAFLFDGVGDERMVAAWAVSGEGTLGLMWDAKDIHAMSALGPTRSLRTEDGVLSLVVSETPLFLTARGIVSELAAGATLGAGHAAAGATLELPLTITNPYLKTMSARLVVNAPESWTCRVPETLVLPPGQTLQIPVHVTLPKQAEPGVREHIQIHWLGQDKRPVAAASATVSVVRKVDLVAAAKRTHAGYELTVSGTTALVDAPAIKSITLSLPQAMGGATEIRGITWQGVESSAADRTPAPTHTFSVSVPVPEPPAFLQETIPVQTAFADGSTGAATVEVGIICAPRKTISEPGDWTGVDSVQVTDFDGPHKDRCSGPKDASASVAIACDSEKLYLHVVVQDDQHEQPYGGTDVWQGDGIQFSIDRHAASRPADAAYMEIGLTKTAKGSEVFRWTEPAGVIAAADCHVTRNRGETVYDAAIPWSELGGEPAAHDTLGFALIVNDRDKGEREGWLRLFDGIGWRKNPQAYGRFFIK